MAASAVGGPASTMLGGASALARASGTVWASTSSPGVAGPQPPVASRADSKAGRPTRPGHITTSVPRLLPRMNPGKVQLDRRPIPLGHVLARQHLLQNRPI